MFTEIAIKYQTEKMFGTHYNTAATRSVSSVIKFSKGHVGSFFRKIKYKPTCKQINPFDKETEIFQRLKRKQQQRWNVRKCQPLTELMT